MLGAAKKNDRQMDEQTDRKKNMFRVNHLSMCKNTKATTAVVGQRSSPAGYILYCNIFIIKPYNIGHIDLDVFVCKSFCHIDIIIQV